MLFEAWVVMRSRNSDLGRASTAHETTLRY